MRWESTPKSPYARAYLIEALASIEARSVYRDTVDWTEVHDTVQRGARDAETPADTYPAIRGALRALQDRRSSLFPAQRRLRVYGTWMGLHALGPNGVIVQVHPGGPADRAGLRVGDTILAIDGQPVEQAGLRPLPLGGQPSVKLRVQRQDEDHADEVTLPGARYALRLLPQGRLLHRHIGYIEIPEHGARSGFDMGDMGRTYAQTAQRIIHDLEGQGARGWIVDLRRSLGQDMYPMIAGLGPLIGEDDCCFLVDPDGERQPITYASGVVSEGLTERITVEDSYTLVHPDAPVAVLIGPLTTGAGEFAALALRNRPATRFFGQSTFGVPTRHETIRLTDGAMLSLTVRLGADRTGEFFDGPIRPDEETSSEWTVFAGSDDATLSRASEWVETMLDPVQP